MDKVKGMVFPEPGNADTPTDGVPWWMKYAFKTAGVISGLVGMLFGILACLTFTPICIVAGIWQAAAGFIMIVIEAPFCCMFFDFVESFARIVDARPAWQKTALYIVLSLPPVFLCTELSTLLGSGMIFATGVLYGLQVIGTKASAADMAAAARMEKQQDERNIMEDQDLDWQAHP